MGKKKRELKQLALTRETLRALVVAELQKVAGGGTGGCQTVRYSGCGTEF